MKIIDLNFVYAKGNTRNAILAWKTFLAVTILESCQEKKMQLANHLSLLPKASQARQGMARLEWPYRRPGRES